MLHIRSIILSSITLLAAMLPVRTDAAASILDLRHEITDTAIVFPESMHTDVHMMRKTGICATTRHWTP